MRHVSVNADLRRRRGILMSLCLIAITGGVLQPAWAQTLPTGAPKPRSPREAAEAIKQQADLVRSRVLPQPAPGRVKKRTGVYYLVSWSIPDEQLKGYLRDAFKLGATVAFRGLVDNDFRKTVDRTKALALALGKEAPHTTIDPIIFRHLNVESVPALAVVRETNALIVEGAAPLAYVLQVMARDTQDLHDLLEWYDGTRRSWERGGPIETPRPAIPTLVGLRHVPTDLTRYPIWEQDLEVVFKEKLRQADWAKLKGQLENKVKDKLHRGPEVPLTPVSQPRVFTVDLTVQFDHDITVPESSAVLIKAGTNVNPLAQATIRHRYVVIDGRDPAQVQFAAAQIHQHGGAWVKVMLSAGDLLAVQKALQHRVYWVMPEIVSRFKLEHVPSVVSQTGPWLKVEEVAL